MSCTTEAWGGEIVVMTPPEDAQPADLTDDEADEGSDDEEETEAAAAAAVEDEELSRRRRRRLLASPPFAGQSVRWPGSAAEAHFLHRRKILTVNGTHTTLAFLTLAQNEPPPHMGLPQGDYELLRCVHRDQSEAALDADEDEEDLFADEALMIDETKRQAWAWTVARQLLLLFESDAEVARAALGCERDTPSESDRALADALLEGSRVAITRLGRGGDTTKRVLGGGVVNRYCGGGHSSLVHELSLAT